MKLDRIRKSFLAAAALCLAGIAGCSSQPAATPVDDAALRNADADASNWITYGRTYAEQRFSPLKQVDEQSVSKLGLAWSKDFSTLRGYESTPLEKDGVLYTTTPWSIVFALDAKTGAQLWTYDPKVPKDHGRYVCCDVVNRGVALYKDKVYVGTLDGRLIALDGKTGAPAWDVQTTPKDGPYAITGAPRIVKGRVVIGSAGSEYPVRGFVSAYDADTGKLAWKTYTVPGDPADPAESEAMKQAAKTWTGEWWKTGGGGSPWDCIVYDPDLDLVYVGTGNASPWYDQKRGHGDNQWVASILALKADTGELVWGYQNTPGDNWDYDSTQPLLLANLKIDGQDRQVIMQANKNGFFYVIDRRTGKLISGTPYTEVNWAAGMDANGRPIENAAIRAMKDATIVRPSSSGGHNWNPISFNPQTGLVYLSVLNSASLHAMAKEWKLDMHDQVTGLDRSYRGPAAEQFKEEAFSGSLAAWDPVARKEAWHVELALPMSGGTLTTAGNLVFHGRADGKLVAYRATDGKSLWEYDTGVGIMAGPMTYSLDGTQYVAVMSGWGGPSVLNNRPVGKGKIGPGRLTVYALGATAKLEIPPAPNPGPVPMPTFKLAVTPAEVAEGSKLFAGYCVRCHGAAAVSGGLTPDVRYSTEATHKAFQDIVRGGALKEFGMASFADSLSAEQVKEIEGYILTRAKEAAEATSVKH